MALVRQLTTAGFRPISKYEHIIPCLSKCYWLSRTVKIVTGALTRNFITLYYSNPILFYNAFHLKTLLKTKRAIHAF